MSSSQRESTDEALRSALRRLLADPAGRRVYGSGRHPGLFPSSTPTTRLLVDEMEQRGLIQLRERHGKATRCELSPKGRQWLLEHENPWLLLEDLLTAAERQHEQLEAFLRVWQDQRDQLHQLREDIRRVLGELSGKRAIASPIADEIKRYLRGYAQLSQPAACSLPELYRQLQQREPNLTVGHFHDELRELHNQGAITFTPWTGPLYELPEPQLSLLIGHEVLYYVHFRRSNAA